ncbi:MAG: caspase family protein [Asgard group archaeon]|nr:caspase family protein [Asgard group archaeon]
MSLKRKALYMTCLTTIFTLSLVSGVITLGANTLRATDITDLDFIEDPNGNAYKYKKGDGEVNKYALLIGISDYNVISDLNYADDDATDWFNFLITLDYQITLLGDSHPEDYPQWDGYATEYNVRVALENILAIADEDDIVVFATSEHGGRGRSTTLDEFIYYLCMWE